MEADHGFETAVMAAYENCVEAGMEKDVAMKVLSFCHAEILGAGSPEEEKKEAAKTADELDDYELLGELYKRAVKRCEKKGEPRAKVREVIARTEWWKILMSADHLLLREMHSPSETAWSISSKEMSPEEAKKLFEDKLGGEAFEVAAGDDKAGMRIFVRKFEKEKEAPSEEEKPEESEEPKDEKEE